MTDNLSTSIPSSSSRGMGSGATKHPISTAGRWCDPMQAEYMGFGIECVWI